MKTYQIPYGKTEMVFHLPDSIPADWIIAKDPPGAENPLSLVKAAIQTPVGVGLNNFAGASSAAIAVNDKTRPVPNDILLPPLLDMLESMGISPAQIHLIIATGTHTPTTPEEYSRTLPQRIIQRYRVTSHNCDDPSGLVNIGTTSFGNPVWINRNFMNADIHIAVGDIEPHHFMGFSGGAKSAAIGLAGRETITRNHSMLSHPNAITAHYADNPMRMEVEEIGMMMELHFCVNAILNLEKQILQVIAGSPLPVMQAGIPLVQQNCQVSVDGNYDLVIASAGGYPKDINFYQSQKALTHAGLIVKPGGTILLAAACSEGSGSQAYESWMEGMSTQQEVFQKFDQEGFQIGPHKAFQIARIAAKANIRLVSELPNELVLKLLLVPESTLDSALGEIINNSADQMKVAIMPFAVSTVPHIH
jgi:nickel-dependent lactate racemase